MLPILGWSATYNREALSGDLLAAVIVTIMLIPQSLAYAMLAGLPPVTGLYASILPLVAYAIFGTSRALAVGPVAVVSLMTASALGKVATTGSADYVAAAIVLAFMSGLMLLAMGLLRLGSLANFLSHPVISGFITASGILIAASQLKHIFGITADGETLPELVTSLAGSMGGINIWTTAIGVSAIAFLFWSRNYLKSGLIGLGVSKRIADVATKAAPVAAVLATIALTWLLSLDKVGVRIVGEIPQGLPPLALPKFDPELWLELWQPALLISIVGFVESISVAQTFAAKKRQSIAPDQELVGLGASNLASAFSGGFPVTGGFSRSAVNYDAGAQTPAAGAFTAVGILLAALLLTPVLYYLPRATLAATIVVAVLALVDFAALRRTWAYSGSDFTAMAATILLTLGLGVETGIMAGLALSIGLHLWRTSRPHYAIVGLVPGTQHFRNVKRHDVMTGETVLTIRIDESLYFPNARFMEELVAESVAARQTIKHVVLMCPAVNHIDASALESLEAINRNLSEAGVTFHMSEVKGPVMDRLKRSHFLDEMTGSVFLSQYDALQALDPAVAAAA